MTPALAPQKIIPAVAQTARIRSIDIFRGLTMLVMIFVNDVASVKGLPWWTYHMNPHISGMTYVDVVFPAFLFALGMSIPLAVRRRLAQGESMPRLWGHILMRSVSLVVLGLVLANASKVDPSATLLPGRWWAALAVLGAILFWLVYPDRPDRRRLYAVLKWSGFALLVAMLAIFRRRTETGELAWLDFGYWEILGLIGRVYLAVCILYIPVRKVVWAPFALLVALTAWNVGSRLGIPPVTRVLPYWMWPFDSGELPSVAMAGIVSTYIFVDFGVPTVLRRKLVRALGYAALLFAAGFAFTGLGISKNAATPTWCLYSAGISVLLFSAIYYLADVLHSYRWAEFVKPAGSNTLLTYLLPDMFNFTCGALYAMLPWQYGWPGVVRSLVFTAAMLGLSALLTRRRIRMQL